MIFAGINYLAVIIAALAGFAIGAAWYMTLGNAWMAALGKTREQLKPSPAAFIITAIALLVMAFVLAGMIGHMGEITIRSGMISAAFVWTGFVATTIAVNYAYQNAKGKLMLIDGGHWLAVLLVMGAVIGAFGT